MNKKPQIIEIINQLLKTKKNEFTKGEIENAIMFTRGLDPRTIENWFNYLWKSGLFQQPNKGIFILNYDRLTELELPTPITSDPEQKRLYNV